MEKEKPFNFDKFDNENPPPLKRQNAMNDNANTPVDLGEINDQINNQNMILRNQESMIPNDDQLEKQGTIIDNITDPLNNNDNQYDDPYKNVTMCKPLESDEEEKDEQDKTFQKKTTMQQEGKNFTNKQQLQRSQTTFYGKQ